MYTCVCVCDSMSNVYVCVYVCICRYMCVYILDPYSIVFIENSNFKRFIKKCLSV